MTLILRAARLGLCTALAALATPACYPDGGNGSAPPTDSLYFPTGLAVSAGGNVLYAVNSDFDLQWNGGTLQSYDLFQIRQDTANLVATNVANASNPNGPFVSPPMSIPFVSPWQAPDPINHQGCPFGQTTPANNGVGLGVLLGAACAPPVKSQAYIEDSVTIGAFATTLTIASALPPQMPTADAGADGGTEAGAPPPTRLFAPVAGNATVTWADIAYDDPAASPQPGAGFAPFTLNCNADREGRCDGSHQTGDDPNSLDNTRNVTMPGEPFGMALTEDNSAMAVTSETDTKTSLLTTGLGSGPGPVSSPTPTMQFVVDGMPNGGVGLAAIPHDRLAGIPRCEDQGNVPPCLHAAFLQTNRSAPEVDLLRYYDDDGSSQHRPYLQKEGVFPITTNSPGSDSRGIAIDHTQRRACELGTPPPGADPQAYMQACAQLPARVFIASRSPPSIIVGQLGQPTPSGQGAYNPDQLVLIGNVPMTVGPSNVYLAPVVVPDGMGGARYALRVFVVCFDSNSIFVYDPAQLMQLNAQPEAIIYTGLGPYALAFDPFPPDQVAINAPVPVDSRQTGLVQGATLNTYRFAYLASFNRSYLQVIDLDDVATQGQTFYSIVYTIGVPTPPKGT